MLEMLQKAIEEVCVEEVVHVREVKMVTPQDFLVVVFVGKEYSYGSGEVGYTEKWMVSEIEETNEFKALMV